jgi:hypothetical protein
MSSEMGQSATAALVTFERAFFKLTPIIVRDAAIRRRPATRHGVGPDLAPSRLLKK